MKQVILLLPLSHPSTLSAPTPIRHGLVGGFNELGEEKADLGID